MCPPRGGGSSCGPNTWPHGILLGEGLSARPTLPVPNLVQGLGVTGEVICPRLPALWGVEGGGSSQEAPPVTPSPPTHVPFTPPPTTSRASRHPVTEYQPVAPVSESVWCQVRTIRCVASLVVGDVQASGPPTPFQFQHVNLFFIPPPFWMFPRLLIILPSYPDQFNPSRNGWEGVVAILLCLGFGGARGRRDGWRGRWPWT